MEAEVSNELGDLKDQGRRVLDGRMFEESEASRSNLSKIVKQIEPFKL